MWSPNIRCPSITHCSYFVAVCGTNISPLPSGNGYPPPPNGLRVSSDGFRLRGKRNFFCTFCVQFCLCYRFFLRASWSKHGTCYPFPSLIYCDEWYYHSQQSRVTLYMFDLKGLDDAKLFRTTRHNWLFCLPHLLPSQRQQVKSRQIRWA